jgi:hypothetical protein
MTVLMMTAAAVSPLESLARAHPALANPARAHPALANPARDPGVNFVEVMNANSVINHIGVVGSLAGNLVGDLIMMTLVVANPLASQERVPLEVASQERVPLEVASPASLAANRARDLKLNRSTTT